MKVRPSRGAVEIVPSDPRSCVKHMQCAKHLFFFRKNKTYIHIPFYTLGLIWFDDHFPMIHDGIPALKRTVFHSMTTSRVTSAALRL